MAKKKREEDYAAGLESSFARWEHLLEHGGSDPFYTDGENMALVRNHIMYYKRQIEETTTALMTFPQIYYRETPPEVDRNYMARADEIREHAQESLAEYLADPDFQFLLRKVDALHPQDAKKVSIQNVIGYASGLADAIDKDDLITMRRHERPHSYQDSFASCAKRIRELKPRENEQFSMFGGYNDDEPDFGDGREEEDWGDEM